MIYYIADCHFFHSVMNTAMDCRGFESGEAMNEYMIRQWNSRVRKNDEVMILGDFSFGTGAQTNELLTRLNGKLYLITGNHDRFLNYRDFDPSRFQWIKPYEERNDNKRKVVLCHYPVMCYNGQYRLDEHDNPRVYMLYGHVHDTHDERLITKFQEETRRTEIVDYKGEARRIPCHMINCFCKFSDYVPLTLDEWIALDEARRERIIAGDNGDGIDRNAGSGCVSEESGDGVEQGADAESAQISAAPDL